MSDKLLLFEGRRHATGWLQRCWLRAIILPLLLFLGLIDLPVMSQTPDTRNPWWPGPSHARWTTPQWVGDDNVDCVITLAIDDMRDPARYEQFLRPILTRLKQIDGRAPVSIMTCRVKPEDSQLQSWLEEGLSIECHTVDHPCPLMHGDRMESAASTFHQCVDLLSRIPGSQPVAFRTPCCDSLNTVSPAFYSEIFSQKSPSGTLLTIDSSVFQFLTSGDSRNPRALVLDDDGNERFLKYMPRNNTRGQLSNDHFINVIYDYPYPYLITGQGHRCWQFPCIAPSDWSAQHLYGINNPKTVEDWKAALDICVARQGVFNLVFHPHGWIKAEQVVELIDHAVTKHGKRVLFLTFREAAERLAETLNRRPSPQSACTDGLEDFQLTDIDGDGCLDIVTASATRIWDQQKRGWRGEIPTPFPFALSGHNSGRRTQFGRLGNDGVFAAVATTPPAIYVLRRSTEQWEQIFETADDTSRSGWQQVGTEFVPCDLNSDGRDEIVTLRNGLYEVEGDCLRRLPFDLPDALVHRKGFADAESSDVDSSRPRAADQFRVRLDDVCFTDLDDDGFQDIVWSQPGGSLVVLFDPQQRRFSRIVLNADMDRWREYLVHHGLDISDGLADAVARQPAEYGAAMFRTEHPDLLPPTSASAGFAVLRDELCWQNVHTDRNNDLVYRVSFAELLSQHRQAEAALHLPPAMIGAARRDVMPSYPVRLTGYGNRRTESEGVALPIFAHALAFSESADGPLTIVVSVDNCGVPDDVTEAVFDRLKEKSDLLRERFVVCSTHTHSGPWLRGFAPYVLIDVPADHAARLQKYEAELIEHLVRVCEQAVQNRRPGRFFVGHGRAEFAINRRVISNGRWTGFGEAPEGPVDHRLPVLAALDDAGKVIAVLAQYACHATTETGSFNRISGDWPGFAAQMLESDLRAAGHKDAVALITIGCGADANPTPRGTHELARQHGRTIADEVLRIVRPNPSQQAPDGHSVDSADWSPRLTPVDHRVSCRLTRVDLPLGPLPSTEELEQMVQRPAHAGVLAQQFLKQLERGKPLPTAVADYPVQTWCFGNDLAMVFLGGEVVADYSMRLHQMLDDARLWVTAYANDVPCYIPSQRILREGGYEADQSMVYYGFPTQLAPETEDIICDTVQKLVPHEFYSDELLSKFPGPIDAEDAVASMVVRPGFRVELVAAEPLITDPVAFDWDEFGRLWVVEMGDYPLGTSAADGRADAVSRVRVLEDTTGDGRYDSAVTFLKDVPFANGICLWNGGVLITAAPNILFAADTDGDLKADVRQVLYTGFSEGNQQHRVNGLRFGLDGWFYLANGDSGGRIRSMLTEGSDIEIRGRDVKIHPGTGRVDVVSGQTQFCRSRDDFGNWFGNNNSNPIWHYILEEPYVRRNPYAAGISVRRDVAEVAGAAPVFPVSRTLERFNDFHAANRFTSACSTMIYRDRVLGDAFYGNAFTCEPVHNLVSRLVLVRDGAGFIGRRADDERDREFFASRDNWCRPVMIRTGPDGGLYIADMYRQVIEHPQWIPAEHQRRLDLYAGCDRGRIYRIVPDDGCCEPNASSRDQRVHNQAAPTANAQGQPNPARNATDVSGDVPGNRIGFYSDRSEVSEAMLIQKLQSKNGWWRDTAQRLLLQRKTVSEQGVQSLLAVCRSVASPAVRVQALWTLATLDSGRLVNGEGRQVLLEALRAEHPEVRRNAVRICEWLPEVPDEIAEALLLRRHDSSAAVLHQLALTLGALSLETGPDTLAALLTENDDRSIIDAALTSLSAENIDAVLTAYGLPSRPDQSRVWQVLLKTAVGFRGPETVAHSLADALADRLHTIAAADGPSGMEFHAVRLILKPLLEDSALAAHLLEHQAISKQLAEFERTARRVLTDNEQSADVRLAALELVDVSFVAESVAELFSAQTPVELQVASLQKLATASKKEFAETLFDQWKNLSPTVRDALLTETLRQPAWTAALLAAVADQKLEASDLSASVRQQLLHHPDKQTAQIAAQILKVTESDRGAIVAGMQQSLQNVTGNPAAGQAVFEKRCSACHRLNRIGHPVGPDLAALKDRSQSALITAILDPNRAVESKYLSYTIVTKNGRTFSGMLAEETSTTLVLVSADAKRHTILRADVDQLLTAGQSLMPERLEKDLSLQDLTDVIAYVQESGRQWKTFEGNAPAVGHAGPDGSLVLTPATAEIYGPSLVLEQKYGNLGFWGSTRDYAVWTIDVPQSGLWTVELNYACADSTAGNLIRFSTGTRLLTARVPGTGSWDQYRTWQAGKLDLGKGRRQLVVSAVEPLNGFLLDLRAIRLIPPQ